MTVIIRSFLRCALLSFFFHQETFHINEFVEDLLIWSEIYTRVQIHRSQCFTMSDIKYGGLRKQNEH